MESIEQSNTGTIKRRTTPRDFFLYVLSMVSLYWSSVNFLTIVFQLTNIWVPDALDVGYSSQAVKDPVSRTLILNLFLGRVSGLL